MAHEIAANRPVASHEVTRWESSGPGVPPTLDFLPVLTSGLSARGPALTVAVAANADIGPAALITPCASQGRRCVPVTLKGRAVILVNADRTRAVVWWNRPRAGTYQAHQIFTR